MDNLVEKLDRDHRRLANVLSQLDRDLAVCRSAQRVEQALLARLKDAVVYIQEYPLHWHHPAEEAIFEKLLGRDIPERPQIETILREHGELEARTQALIDGFNALLNSGGSPGRELLEQTATMIAKQMDHQQRENRDVYPLVDRYLRDSEWQVVMHRIYALPHNAAIERHYLSLYHHLTRQHGDG